MILIQSINLEQNNLLLIFFCLYFNRNAWIFVQIFHRLPDTNTHSVYDSNNRKFLQFSVHVSPELYRCFGFRKYLRSVNGISGCTSNASGLKGDYCTVFWWQQKLTKTNIITVWNTSDWAWKTCFESESNEVKRFIEKNIVLPLYICYRNKK